MKRFFLSLVMVLVSTLSIFAQTENTPKSRRTYLNIGFPMMSMSHDYFTDLKSGYGASLTIGTTYYINKEPIAGVLHIGIDATWFDANFVGYHIEHSGYWGKIDYPYYEGEVSVHLGPSITLNFPREFKIHAYYRIAPSISYLYEDLYYSHRLGYSTFFNGGVSISKGVFGIGIENRIGNCQYQLVDDPCISIDMGKVKHNGWRGYITYRF